MSHYKSTVTVSKPLNISVKEYLPYKETLSEIVNDTTIPKLYQKNIDDVKKIKNILIENVKYVNVPAKRFLGLFGPKYEKVYIFLNSEYEFDHNSANPNADKVIQDLNIKYSDLIEDLNYLYSERNRLRYHTRTKDAITSIYNYLQCPVSEHIKVAHLFKEICDYTFYKDKVNQEE